MSRNIQSKRNRSLGNNPQLRLLAKSNIRFARRNCVTEKKPNSTATQTASAISQCATSRVHARNAALSQASANTANTAPITS